MPPSLASPHRSEGIGELFKNVGSVSQRGPVYIGDYRDVVGSECNYTEPQRIEGTYNRKTHSYKQYAEPIEQLIKGMAAVNNEATAGTRSKLRQWMHETFDIPQVLTYYAVSNFANYWDDKVHNSFIYQRSVDKKWTLSAWDTDSTMGINSGATFGLRAGADTTSCPINCYNYLERALISVAFPYEYEVVMRNLVLYGALQPTRLQATLDKFWGMWNLTETQICATQYAHDFPGCYNKHSAFFQARANNVLSTFVPPPASRLGKIIPCSLFLHLLLLRI